MKKLYLIAVIALILFSLVSIQAVNAEGSPNNLTSNINDNPDKVTVYFFWGEGCPYCSEEEPFLDSLEEKYPELEVKSFETWYNQENAELFQEVAKAYGIQARGVPTTFIGEEHWVGFSSSMEPEIEEYVKNCIENGCENKAEDVFKESQTEDVSEESQTEDVSENDQSSEICMHVFLREDCPQCTNIENYLGELDEKYAIEINKYDVTEDENKELFQQFKERYGLKADAYPAIFIGDKYILGEEPIKTALEGEIETCLDESCPCPLSKVKSFTPMPAKPEDVTSEKNQTIDLLGKELDIGKMPLVFSTFVISFIDGFNPCSLWVITFLLSIVILTGSRKKIFAIGFTYLATAGAVYGAFILGMVSVFSYIGYLIWIRVLVASIAMIFALVNIKDFFWYKKGLSFTIPDAYKPKIFKKIRNLMKPENKLRTLIFGSMIMALGITLVELPCTAGFPMVWSNIVAAHSVSLGFFITLFLIYMLTYFSIELVIFLSAVFTLRTSKIEKKHGRLLKLIGGAIMFALAMVLLFNPDLLNDIGSTILIFAGATGLSLLIAGIYSKLEGFKNNENKLDSKQEEDAPKNFPAEKTKKDNKIKEEKKDND